MSEERDTKQLFGESKVDQENGENKAGAEKSLQGSGEAPESEVGDTILSAEYEFENGATQIGTPSPLLAPRASLEVAETAALDSNAVMDLVTSEPREPKPLVDEEHDVDNVDNLALGELLLGKYRIESCIGAGGFGIVYRAKNVDTGEMVAVKTLRRSLPEYKLAEKRFEREVTLTRSLTSQHTLKILDFGKSQRGIHFFVMELLIGQTLDEYLEDGKRYNFVELVSIISQALESLSEAHALGIVHRDLKPSNIFLCEAPKNEFYIKILDFGIAKISDPGEEAYNEKLTRTGSSFGSPAYMSPEQVSSGQLGPSSDVYAIGLIMLEMLTGCPVFQGNTAFDVALQQLAPVSVVFADWIGQSSIGPIIERCVQKKPAERYPDAQELLADIRALQPKVLAEDYRKAQRSHFLSHSASSPPAIATNLAHTQTAPHASLSAHSKKQFFLYAGIIAVGLIVVVLLILQLYVKKLLPPQTPSEAEHSVQAVKLNERQTALVSSAALGAGSGGIELRKVAITVASSPAKARLIRVRDGKDFGQTPVSMSLIRSSTIENYVLSYPDYEDYTLPLSSMRGETIAVTLAPKLDAMVPDYWTDTPQTPSGAEEKSPKDEKKVEKKKAQAKEKDKKKTSLRVD